MSRRNLFIVQFMFAVACSSLSAQDSLSGKPTAIIQAMKVSMIGDDESQQSSLNMECADILLNIEGLDMSQAYTLWLSMLSDLEVYANQRDVDIKGLRLWMNVYWNQDGTIRHMNFYPKPNSKNIDFDLFSQFLNGFAQDYILPVSHVECFSHYGSASFPTFYDQLLKKE